MSKYEIIVQPDTSPKGKKRCYNCNGNGYVTKFSKIGNHEQTYEEHCNKCNGNGFVNKRCWD